jgi:transposase
METNIKNLFNEQASAEKHKRKKAKSKQVFKPYQQHQAMLLPPSLEELIPPQHLVRVVNNTIDKLNIEPLLATYKGDGTSAYHPLMLLKVLIYAYLTKTYASRLIAKALKENVHFMWLSGMSMPDFRTINDFRSSRLKEVIYEVFASMILFCQENNYINLEHYFVDGTKLQANANRHHAVWAKNTKRYKLIVQEKIKELSHQIDEVNRQENDRYGNRDLEEMGNESAITSEHLKEQIENLNTLIETSFPKGMDSQNSKATKKAIKVLATKHLPKLEKYEQQEKLLAGRNSYSSTDTDATFFRTKDGRLLPAYNVLIGTENQFITNFSLHQKASETDQFIQHFEQFKTFARQLPRSVIGDAAYGSEENYYYLQMHQIEPLLKYNTYHFERTKKYRDNAYHKDKFQQNPDNGTYTCPQGRAMEFKHSYTRTTDNGYEQTFHTYECRDCSQCPVASHCKKGNGNRTIQINPQLDTYRAHARARLTTPEGYTLYKRRSIEPEPVFGDIKWNQKVERFLLRGKDKITLEFGLHCIAHNTKKIAQFIN